MVALAATIGQVGFLQAEEQQNLVPEVSSVTMKQVAFTRDVKITYQLASAAAIITLAIETNGVALPSSVVSRLEGDVNVKVQNGEEAKSIIWHAGADWPENMTDAAVAKVTA